jgi:hypothetical protein
VDDSSRYDGTRLFTSSVMLAIYQKKKKTEKLQIFVHIRIIIIKGNAEGFLASTRRTKGKAATAKRGTPLFKQKCGLLRNLKLGRWFALRRKSKSLPVLTVRNVHLQKRRNAGSEVCSHTLYSPSPCFIPALQTLFCFNFFNVVFFFFF